MLANSIAIKDRLPTFTIMEPTPTDNPAKKIQQSMLINLALALFAMSTFLNALKSGESWRILLSATGSVFFTVVTVRMILKLVQLRKGN
jgi:hypothetical protein